MLDTTTESLNRNNHRIYRTLTIQIIRDGSGEKTSSPRQPNRHVLEAPNDSKPPARALHAGTPGPIAE